MIAIEKIRILTDPKRRGHDRFQGWGATWGSTRASQEAERRGETWVRAFTVVSVGSNGGEAG